MEIATLGPSIAEATAKTIQEYLDALGDNNPANVYRMAIDELEKPLLKIMMRYTHDNQSKAAECLGINRATLRTKLRRHNLI